MVIAAIDYGERRLGIAATDPAGIVVYPAGTIQRRTPRSDLVALSLRLKELEASRVIVGWPLNMDGSTGPASRRAAKFAEFLRRETGLEVELYDERLSTFEAKERMKIVSKRRRREFVDAIAATVILESWLQSRKRRSD